ncbi:hypothetical protein niasHT_027071 [Heterodera trifolii]|uniref:Uncharacterized protein n=1 Tax=Heterodera trifolii TaxID=157864 RepID=A0ABD2KT90_9BILA
MDKCQKRVALPAELIWELSKAMPLAKCHTMNAKLRKKSKKANNKEKLLVTELRTRSKMLTKLKMKYRQMSKRFMRHERKLARHRFNCRMCGGLEDMPGTIAYSKKLYTEKYKNCMEIVALAKPLKEVVLASEGNGKMFGDDEAKLLSEAEEYITEFEQSYLAKEL